MAVIITELRGKGYIELFEENYPCAKNNSCSNFYAKILKLLLSSLYTNTRIHDDYFFCTTDTLLHLQDQAHKWLGLGKLTLQRKLRKTSLNLKTDP